MKKRIIPVFLVLFTVNANAQQLTGIRSKQQLPKAGIENQYVYTPSKTIKLPAKLRASIIYYNKDYANKVISLTKAGNSYEFSFTAPDSTAVLLMAIVDDYKNVVDNNNGRDYIFKLYDATGKPFPSALATTAGLLQTFTNYAHKTETASAALLRMYEQGFKQHPAGKQGPIYIRYLQFLYKEKGAAAKPQLFQFANEQVRATADEAKWRQAATIYTLLKMDEDKGKTEEKILAAFPLGLLARDRFWSSFYSEQEHTEQTVLAAMDQFIQKFRDSSAAVKDVFYMGIINLLAKNNDKDGIFKYSALVSNKIWLAGSYNNFAWGFSGGSTENVGTNLEFAKLISKLSVDYIEDRMRQALPGDDADDLVGAHIGYSDTYALILYHLGQFDSAFYYQHAILERGPMGVEGMERYAVYAEKAKGAAFARDFIEPELLKGANSPVMLKQLERLYKELNLPGEQFVKVKTKAAMLARKKTAEDVIARFGTQKGSGFTLKDLQGQPISLASLKNKVVVIDFWATWCGPCRASFPAMQDLVNKYKNDKDVVFLFIDTWEGKDAKEMRDNAAQFIEKNKYSFQVLLDDRDKVVGAYKVEGIPAKFILDKKGNIVFMGGSADLGLAIEAARETY